MLKFKEVNKVYSALLDAKRKSIKDDEELSIIGILDVGQEVRGSRYSSYGWIKGKVTKVFKEVFEVTMEDGVVRTFELEDYLIVETNNDPYIIIFNCEEVDEHLMNVASEQKGIESLIEHRISILSFLSKKTY